MTRAKKDAQRFRRIILIAGIVYLAAAAVWATLPFYYEALVKPSDFFPAGLLGTPLALGMSEDEPEYAINLLVLMGLILLAQYCFLMPRGAWTARLAAQGRPLKSAIIVAAAMAALLTLGAVALAMEIPDSWAKWMDDQSTPGQPGFRQAAPYLLGGMLVAWAAWCVVFVLYIKQGDRYSQLSAILRGLISGSLLEAFVAVPVHVWATRQRECYCTRGTYTTLVCAGTVLLWAFGPAIALLYLREKHRAARLLPRCEKCDYDLRGIDSDCCPECGWQHVH